MSVQFFLGSNSGDGFYSLYDSFACAPGDRLYLIKAGPGCGKSTFMKKLASKAEEQGFTVEYILCSGDPESLDGIYIPALHLGFADATAPHILEPRLFAVDSCYVNLGQFCADIESEKIREYTAKYRRMYKTAYGFLSAAKTIKKVQIPELISDNDIVLAESRAESALLREFGKKRGSAHAGSITKRFIRGISCMGEICLSGTVNMLCKRIYLVDDRLGLANAYLKRIARGVAERGENAIVCPSPLCPDELDAVLLPNHALGFVSASVMQVNDPWRHVRLDALVATDIVRAHRSELKAREKQYRSLLDCGIGYLKQAKKYHDLLEGEYKPHVDFTALTEFTEREMTKLIT